MCYFFPCYFDMCYSDMKPLGQLNFSLLRFLTNFVEFRNKNITKNFFLHLKMLINK